MRATKDNGKIIRNTDMEFTKTNLPHRLMKANSLRTNLMEKER
jgi:hypothetical protein